jgi:hypothetical protein
LAPDATAVNWVDLEDVRSVFDQTNIEARNKFIEYIDRTARSRDRQTPQLSFQKLWNRNPYLCQWSRTNRCGPWGVPLPKDIKKSRFLILCEEVADIYEPFELVRDGNNAIIQLPDELRHRRKLTNDDNKLSLLQLHTSLLVWLAIMGGSTDYGRDRAGMDISLAEAKELAFCYKRIKDGLMVQMCEHGQILGDPDKKCVSGS